MRLRERKRSSVQDEARSPGTRIAVVGVLLAAVFAALSFGRRIHEVGLWRDEAVTAGYANLPTSLVLELAERRDASTTLFYLIVGAVGTHGEDIRSISLIAMLASALIVGLWLSRREPLWALMAVALLLSSPLTLRYALEARPAALALMVGAVSTFALVAAKEIPESKLRWAAYGITLLFLGYLQFTALSLLAGHCCALACFGVPRDIWRRWFISLAVPVIGSTPLLILLIKQRGQVSWLQSPDPQDVVGPFVEMLGGAGALAACFVSWGVAMFRSQRQGSSGWRVGLAVFALAFAPPLSLAAVSQVVPLYAERYVIFCMAGVALWGAWSIRRAGLFVGAATAVLVLGMGLAGGALRDAPATRGEDLREAALVTRAHGQVGDGIVYAPGMWRLARYGYPADFAGLHDIAVGEVGNGGFERWFPPQVAGPELESRAACVDRLWVLREVRPAGRALDPEAAATLKTLEDWTVERTWDIAPLALDLRVRPSGTICQTR